MMYIAQADLVFIIDMVKERSGIEIDRDKDYLLAARLGPLVREEGLADLAALAARLRRPDGERIQARVVDLMTTNETLFFRDVHPFENLRTNVLPALIAKNSASRRLNIWCAAASTGQEPYSIAILIREHFPVLRDWQVSILGTDISEEALARAREGRYGQFEVARGMPTGLLGKHFVKEDRSYVVVDDVRQLVEFRALNLIQPWPNMPRMDVVFIRNVLIYFDAPTRHDILARVRDVMHPDGYLYLGGAELSPDTSAFVPLAAPRSGCYRPTSPSRPGWLGVSLPGTKMKAG